MLGLANDTDARWVEHAARDLDALLADHAHCELKAAQSALSIVGRFGDEHPGLVAPLLALAREELEHFEEVVARVRARGAGIGRPAVDDFVASLRAAARSDASAGAPLLDRLLVSALIEARSCERFRLLAAGLSDEALRSFYRDLMASEARHYRLFVELAEQVFGAARAAERLDELRAREGAVASSLGARPTVHG